MKCLSFLFFALLPVLMFAQTSGAQAAPKKIMRREFPPEAFLSPTNHILVADVGGAADAEWLREQCAEMGKFLHVNMVSREIEASEGELACPRKLVRRLKAEDPKAVVVLLLAKGEDLPPILSSPYEQWAMMDAGWVSRAGGEPALVQERMGKRLYQTLGFCIGAGMQMDPKAVMRPSPTIEALDRCLSRNFHPINSSVFATFAQTYGLGLRRLRPRKELEEMGLLPPRKPKKADAGETPPQTDK